MDLEVDKSTIIVHLVRLGMSARVQDVQAFAKRVIRKVKKTDQDLANSLIELLANNPSQGTPLREVGVDHVPVDVDSRLHLIKHEYPVSLDVNPILPSNIESIFAQILAERQKADELLKAGLEPTRSLLLVGPPGVGKTLCSRWFAAQIGWPILTLDLSTVMSSFLGKTGTNLRSVLEFAKQGPCILLLDEFDAIAKRRDDTGEIGELKRLVTVLLQEIDDWPSQGLLIAATNHPKLLDPAVWRRFDLVTELPKPDVKSVAEAISLYFGAEFSDLTHILPAMTLAWKNLSFSDIARLIAQIKRRAIISGVPVADVVVSELTNHIKELSGEERKILATDMIVSANMSQRRASELTGVSRDTIRKFMKSAHK